MAKLSYTAALKILEGRTNFEKEMPANKTAFKHAVMQKFMQLNPQVNNLKIIHIAGTKGKGSTAAMTHAIIRQNGYSCGLFTSPHLIHWQERIRINDSNISNEAFCCHMDYLTKIKFLDQPTYFEYLTMLALLEFNAQKMDFVILETGLGGRLDTTNIIKPTICAITRISKDHCSILGNTISKIAKEKAGIIKLNTPIVTGEQHWRVKNIIKEVALQNNAQLFTAAAYNWAPLVGQHQRQNFGISVCIINILKQMGFNLSQPKQPLRVNWQGRFQYIKKNPIIIIDGSHNPDSTKVLIKTWNTEIGNKFDLYFGSTNDKDWQSSLKILKPYINQAYFVSINSKRSVLPNKLMQFANQLGIKSQIGVVDDIKYTKNSTLCCGSLYLVGKILSLNF